MKKIFFLNFIILGFWLASCTPDKKEDIISPAIDARDKYLGSWTCNETSQVSGSTSYPISISKSSTNSSEILISRFYDIPSQEVRASVTDNTISIPYQQLGNVGFTKGTGSINSNGSNLSLAYSTTVSANTDTCTASCTK